MIKQKLQELIDKYGYDKVGATYKNLRPKVDADNAIEAELLNFLECANNPGLTWEPINSANIEGLFKKYMNRVLINWSSIGVSNKTEGLDYLGLDKDSKVSLPFDTYEEYLVKPVTTKLTQPDPSIDPEVCEELLHFIKCVNNNEHWQPLNDNIAIGLFRNSGRFIQIKWKAIGGTTKADGLPLLGIHNKDTKVQILRTPENQYVTEKKVPIYTSKPHSEFIEKIPFKELKKAIAKGNLAPMAMRMLILFQEDDYYPRNHVEEYLYNLFVHKLSGKNQGRVSISIKKVTALSPIKNKEEFYSHIIKFIREHNLPELKKSREAIDVPETQPLYDMHTEVADRIGNDTEAWNESSPIERLAWFFYLIEGEDFNIGLLPTLQIMENIYFTNTEYTGD